MTSASYHAMAEKLMNSADELRRVGFLREAAMSYESASKYEWLAYRATDTDKPRTRNILAVSAVSCAYRQAEIDNEQGNTRLKPFWDMALWFLQEDSLNDAARAEIAEMVREVCEN